jgi:hypothetical protein
MITCQIHDPGNETEIIHQKENLKGLQSSIINQHNLK